MEPCRDIRYASPSDKHHHTPYFNMQPQWVKIADTSWRDVSADRSGGQRSVPRNRSGGSGASSSIGREEASELDNVIGSDSDSTRLFKWAIA